MDFLLKGLAMERDLDRPGMNESDQWRSHWIDCLVRERVLQRELVPHRHNPDDLVPVIQNSCRSAASMCRAKWTEDVDDEELASRKWLGIPPHKLFESDSGSGAQMVTRVVVSVQQFTSFRNFAWCPLGSLHRRLREFDSGVTFQYAVEYLLVNEMVTVQEYPNPRSDYNTKGIELNPKCAFVAVLLAERDEFVRVLLEMYNENQTISVASVSSRLEDSWNVDLWISIMRIENVLNVLPGRTDQYSLFRTHHTVKLVANDDVNELQKADRIARHCCGLPATDIISEIYRPTGKLTCLLGDDNRSAAANSSAALTQHRRLSDGVSDAVYMNRRDGKACHWTKRPRHRLSAISPAKQGTPARRRCR